MNGFYNYSPLYAPNKRAAMKDVSSFICNFLDGCGKVKSKILDTPSRGLYSFNDLIIHASGSTPEERATRYIAVEQNEKVFNDMVDTALRFGIPRTNLFNQSVLGFLADNTLSHRFGLINFDHHVVASPGLYAECGALAYHSRISDGSILIVNTSTWNRGYVPWYLEDILGKDAYDHLCWKISDVPYLLQLFHVLYGFYTSSDKYLAMHLYSRPYISDRSNNLKFVINVYSISAVPPNMRRNAFLSQLHDLLYGVKAVALAKAYSRVRTSAGSEYFNYLVGRSKEIGKIIDKVA